MKIKVVRTSKKIIRLIKNADGSVTVVANKNATSDDIMKVVRGNVAWLLPSAGTDCESENCAVDVNDLRELLSCKKCMLFGEIIDVAPTVERSVRLESGVVYLPDDKYKTVNLRKQSLTQFVRKTAREQLSCEISEFGSRIALCPTKITFKSCKGDGWYDCTNPSIKCIAIDYRVVELPKRLRNYVYAHVFTHFVIDGHRSEFFERLETLEPHYADIEKRLNDYLFLKDIFA